MSWNTFLYEYHKKYGGLYLGGGEDDALLVLTYRDQPLAVDLIHDKGTRYATERWTVRARIPAVLEQPYTLTIGARSLVSGGVNAVLQAVDRGLDALPAAPELSADYGCPEVTKRRLIRTGNRKFTKSVLGSLALRNALLASPWDRLEVRPGPGEGLHLVTVLSDAGGREVDNDNWPLEDAASYLTSYGPEEGAEKVRRICEDRFLPRMDQLLELTRAARDAVMAWRM